MAGALSVGENLSVDLFYRQLHTLRGIYLVWALLANLFDVITLMRYLPAFQSCFRKQKVVAF